MKLEADLEKVVAYGETEAPDAFAGAERGDDGTILAGFTRDDEHHVDELSQRVAVPSRLRTFPARWTLRELEDLRERADGDMSSYDFERDGFRVSVSYLELPENAIVWEVFSADPAETQRLLDERYGGSVKAIVLGPSPTGTEPVECHGYELVGSTTLRLWYSRGPESTLAAIELNESERRVEVTVLVNQYLGAARPEVGSSSADAALAAPLRDRDVFDTVSGRTLAMNSFVEDLDASASEN
jgi:hypothetical protein